MEVKELMIGDYVNYRGQIIKVTSLYDKGGSNEVGWSDKESVWVNAYNVEPIPITPEILKKNGFSDNYAVDDQSYAVDAGGDVVGVHIIGKGGIMDEMYFKYVHELQQAMRIMGCDKEIIL